jgi:hypothetical protein
MNPLLLEKSAYHIYMKNLLHSVKIEKLMKNKVVLWLLFAIALVNMYAYLMSANELYIAFMLLTGFILSFFSKNMVVILFFSICIPSLLRFVMEWNELQEGLSNNTIREGLETNDNATTQADNSSQSATKDFVFPTDKLERMKTIIANAIDKADKIDDPNKRSETKTLLELEENVIDQLGLIGKMLTKNKGGSLEASPYKSTDSSSSDKPTESSSDKSTESSSDKSTESSSDKSIF